MCMLLLFYILCSTVLALSLSMASDDAAVIKVIEVNKLDIHRPIKYKDADSWHLKIETKDETYACTLTETHAYHDDHAAILYTEGTVTTGPSEQQQVSGTARIIFEVSEPAQLRAQGSIRLGSRTLHLDSLPSAHLKEEVAQPAKRDSLHQLETHLISGFKRSGDVAGTNGLPTTMELQAALNDNASSQCFHSRLRAEIGVAADSNFLRSFSSIRDARIYIADTVNKASEVWERAFNISLVLSEIVTASDTGGTYPWDSPCNPSVNSVGSLDTRLEAMTDWRSQYRKNDGRALWSLWTDCPSGDVIGLSWQSTACEPGGVNVVHHSTLDYRVFAHETGHVFGAVHDCTNVTCGTSTSCCPLSTETCDAHGAYIMNPGTDDNQWIFSQCSRDNICAGIVRGHTNVSCLARERSRFDFIESKACENMSDPFMYEECLRDIQCIEYTNSTSSFFCGGISACSLECYMPKTYQCESLRMPLFDRTPCGHPGRRRSVCYAGKCRAEHSGLGLIWIAIGFGIFAGLGCIGSGFYVLVRRRSASQRQPSRNTQSDSLSSKSTLARRTLSTAGFPPILKYSPSTAEEPATSGRVCQ